ncbi:ornithine racemase Orr [Alloiococcus sp. CFN-8]|uniref:ornithine racemase Orr n=1 Tax=Alloiococcus sp. CFN-8 TaxID=3416081 RepID=UPI003CF231CA
MTKKYPCIEIDLSKITYNSKKILSYCSEAGIKLTAVTKVFCGKLPVVEAVLKSGITSIGDSRIENLRKLKDLPCEKMLLRIPMLDEIEEVVAYSDITLDSELRTIEEISRVAQKYGVKKKIVLMVDLGDLREGVPPEEAINTIDKILNLENIELVGLGTNLTCYGGVIPDEENLGMLVRLKDKVKYLYSLELPIISGGNSSSLHLLFKNKMPRGINNLRVGEAIALGRETAYGEAIEGLYNDTSILKAQIVELKRKKSVPKGKLGRNAFGEVPEFVDRGVRKRAILAVGKQDIVPEGLTPLDPKIIVIGASSDHLILDVTDSSIPYKVGDIIEFTVDYGCLLAAMTSEYVKKCYV